MLTTTGSLRFSTVCVLTALLAGGCDESAGGRGGSGQPGSGGKADDTNMSIPTSGPAVVWVELAADPHNFGEVDTIDFEIYWGDEVDPDNRMEVGKEFPTHLTGKDCVTVVSKNPARSIYEQPPVVTTRSCDLGLVPDPEIMSVLSLPTVTMSVPDLPVDFGADFELIGLGGPSVVDEAPGGFHGLPVDETYVFAPGDYEIKVGHDPRLGLETPAHAWQVSTLHFGQFADLRDGLTFPEDPRTQIFIEAPANESALPSAVADSNCQLRTEVWVTSQTDMRSHKYDLGKDQELYFMPFAGAKYDVRVAGITQWADWRLPNGQFVSNAYVPTFVHEVPFGPEGEQGSYQIESLGDRPGHISCQGTGIASMKNNSTFRVGTHMILPEGTYLETVTYSTGTSVQREFKLGG